MSRGRYSAYAEESTRDVGLSVSFQAVPSNGCQWNRGRPRGRGFLECVQQGRTTSFFIYSEVWAPQ